MRELQKIHKSYKSRQIMLRKKKFKLHEKDHILIIYFFVELKKILVKI